MDVYLAKLGKLFSGAVATILVAAVLLLLTGGLALLLQWIASWF